MNADQYSDKFNNLKVNTSGGYPSPHKPCMLLAVFDLALSGALDENRIYYTPYLIDRYKSIFDLVKTGSDHPDPYFPFFHLKTSGFWHLKALPGRETVLENLSTARSQILENIEYAYLDAELFGIAECPAVVVCIALSPS